MKLVFWIICLFFLISCGNEVTDNASSISVSNEVNYLPKKIGDTFLYVGFTHYSDILDNYDTSYTDSIKLFQLSADSFYYLMKQVKYKEIPPIDDYKGEDITLVEIYNSFEINNSKKYVFEYSSKYLSKKTLISFTEQDSIYFSDIIIRASENKKEDRTFKGKLLK